MQTLKKILYLLSAREQKKAILLFIMMILMALLDLIGIASVLPFMTVLTNPEIIETNNLYNLAYNLSGIFGIDSNQEFIFALGILVFILLIVSLAFKTLTIYVQLRFALMREYSIGKRLIEGYLHQSYSWFLNRHSADLSKTILSEVSIVIAQGVKPMMNLMSQSVVIIFLILLLIFVDPKITLIVGLTISGAYGAIYLFTHSFLKKIGKERLKANEERFKVVSEAFGASKEVKIGGLEQIYVNRFSVPAKTFARVEGNAQVISQLPRFALEAIIFGGMMLIVLYLMRQSVIFIDILPKITFFAFAGYRLMPALQQVYRAGVQLRFIEPALDTLKNDLESLNSITTNREEIRDFITLNKEIKLNHINYNYPNASRTALDDINLKIPVLSTVGLVGTTGSGKTTTVDIILGLLEPHKGTLEVDGQVIGKKNRRAWQNTIGYVPQQIFLSDDTITANIAFGVDAKKINKKEVESAAKIANLHEFVINELPQKYETNVGERGVRLSGGQRQRIGIARALYNNPKVLILDEATSALDNLTEQAVMEAVNNIGKKITIIIIAHRLSTVKKCDIIFLLEKGKLRAQGTFEKLIQASDRFRENAKKL
jgi:ABC-type multidrug transport system fused ATPase/permease subunit